MILILQIAVGVVMAITTIVFLPSIINWSINFYFFMCNAILVIFRFSAIIIICMMLVAIVLALMAYLAGLAPKAGPVAGAVAAVIWFWYKTKFGTNKS